MSPTDCVLQADNSTELSSRIKNNKQVDKNNMTSTSPLFKY